MQSIGTCSHLIFLNLKEPDGSGTRARSAGFLWERVVEMMGSSGGSGGVERSGEEVVAGLAGKNGVNSVGLNVGGEDRKRPDVIFLRT
uniref:Uncharacterized protein n=1 Tax=Tanacetum cinerariifolium TaxID=118510 RepID=A0A6L2JRB7_TANCI|nr:hypothetical protein [Tanacetum cinerariifolium]